MRNTQTREGFELWDKLNSLPRYAFLLSPSGKSVQKFEDQAMGNWIDVHEARMVIEQAQEVISELRDEIATSPEPDTVLCKFYDVTDWPGLVRELVGHVAQLQESAKRNVKPWEDTFPPTLLPAYVERVNTANALAMPQGEPVAWMDPRSPEMHATISNEVKQHNLKFVGAPSAAVNGYSIPLYAEQPAPVAVVMSFDFEHPSSKERRTVALSKQDVFDGMEDYFYDKIGEQICRCESVGETNVVDCSCDEYVHDFEIVKASLTS